MARQCDLVRRLKPESAIHSAGWTSAFSRRKSAFAGIGEISPSIAISETYAPCAFSESGKIQVDSCQMELLEEY
jgi:hypothetical protein